MSPPTPAEPVAPAIVRAGAPGTSDATAGAGLLPDGREPAAEGPTRRTPPDESPGGRWLWLGAAALALAALGVVFAAFHSNSARAGRSAGKQPTAASSTTNAPTTTTTQETTTSTSPLPVAPQQSAEGAASALVGAWAAGNQARALTVGTNQAVGTLFAQPYHSGMAIDRGCRNGPSPVTCAFGPPGGASPTDPLYSITVSQAPSGGWYVSAVQVEP